MDKYKDYVEDIIRNKDINYIKEFESLPELGSYIVIASSIEPNKYHKGEFVMKQILQDKKGKRFKRMIFIEKSHIKRIMEEINRR